MKRTRPLFVLIFLALAAASIFFMVWSRYKPAVHESNNPIFDGISNSSGIPTESRNTNDLDMPPEPETMPVTKGATRNRYEDIKSLLQEKNVPMEFCGQVLDQDGQPLLGAIIQAHLRQWGSDAPTLMGGRSIKLKSETDLTGRFELRGEEGDSVGIERITKDGYELEPNTQLTYGPVSGSYSHPVKFIMWKSDIKEALIRDSKSFRIVPDGRAYYIDLRNGTIGETGEGDIKASIKYAAEVTPNQTYDWSAQIVVPGGGLIEETNANSSMYLAPTNGYTPEFRLDQRIRGGQHGSIGTRRFYVKLKNGAKYGRIEIQMNAPYNNQVPGRIRITYAVNPSGSQVLR